jgi:6-phosphogluconolactonase
MAMPANAETRVYISCADDGDIVALELNGQTGGLKMLGKTKAGKVVMPIAVSPDRRYLYAGIRSVPYGYASYTIDPDKGLLTHLSTVPAPDNMTYIATDRTGRFLHGATYAAHRISVNPIGKTGSVQAEATQIMETGCHAHAIRTDSSNRFVFVPLLGADLILQMTFDEKRGILSPNHPAEIKTGANAGPRHIVFSPGNRFVYVVTELTGMVYAYALDGKTGLLKEIQSISALPAHSNLLPGKVGAPIGGPQPHPTPEPVSDDEPRIQAADIHITPDGRFLYASERTSSTLAAFAVDGTTGLLHYLDQYDTETEPRGFAIDPGGRFLLAAGQKSGHCQVYRIDPETGGLKRLNRVPVGGNPTWIEVVDLPQSGRAAG